MGGGYTMMHDFPNGFPQNPNAAGRGRSHDLELQGVGFVRRAVGHPPVADAPSPVGRQLRAHHHDLGAGRFGAFSASGTHYVEPSNSNREDNIWVFDIRAEKTINITSRIRLRAYLDAFNLTNSHASETIARATGPQYQKPRADSRAAHGSRLGFRFIF